MHYAKFQLRTVISMSRFEKQVPHRHVVRNKCIALTTLGALFSSLSLLSLVKAP